MRPLYRLRQFFQAIFVRPDIETLNEIEAELGPQLFGLFSQMTPFDQEHSIRVYWKLLECGETDSDLLAAGLLHDVGKSRNPLPIYERAIVVLFRGFFANRHLGSGGSIRWWERPFYNSQYHPTWGAEMALEHGASEKTAAFIRRHQDQLPASPGVAGEMDRMLSVLQEIDSKN
jgi:putative nucleotidyltransferase with HDIG domain